jgi:hypothetical protein
MAGKLSWDFAAVTPQTHLEAGGAPVHELNGPLLGLDVGQWPGNFGGNWRQRLTNTNSP